MPYYTYTECLLFPQISTCHVPNPASAVGVGMCQPLPGDPGMLTSSLCASSLSWGDVTRGPVCGPEESMHPRPPPQCHTQEELSIEGCVATPPHASVPSSRSQNLPEMTLCCLSLQQALTVPSHFTTSALCHVALPTLASPGTLQR